MSLQLWPLIVVAEDERVELQCEFTLLDSAVAADTPDDYVDWSFESSSNKLPEHLSSTSSRFKAEQPLEIRSKLVIEHLKPNRQGIYSCQMRVNSAATSRERTPTVTRTLVLLRSAPTATQATSSIREEAESHHTKPQANNFAYSRKHFFLLLLSYKSILNLGYYYLGYYYLGNCINLIMLL